MIDPLSSGVGGASSVANVAAIERQILAKIATVGVSGILHSVLKAQFLGVVDLREFNEAIRNLRACQKIAFERQGTEQLVMLMKLKSGLSDNFNLVLEVVRASGSAGIDAVSVAQKTKLVRSEVTKGLAALLQQGVIKETRCFQNKARKLYILSELQPSVDVTGGTFYTESREVDYAFIDGLRLKCAAYVEARSVASVVELKHMLDSESSGRPLTVKEVEIVMNTLVADGIVEAVASAPLDGPHRGSTKYCTATRPVQQLGLRTGAKVPTASGRMAAVVPPEAPDGAGRSLLDFASFPCVGCPQLDQCSARGKGLVSPIGCPFLDDFLSLS